MQLNKKIRIAIIGASGRLGKSIGLLAQRTERFYLAKAFGRSDSPLLGSEIGLSVPLSADLLNESFDIYIDASLPNGLKANLQAAITSNRPIVVGCTGLNNSDRLMLKTASQLIPVFYSANFSIGMAILHKLVKLTTRWFNPEAKIDLIETHHLQKKDAPSGSALSLSAVIEKNHPLASKPFIQSIREKEVIGKHEICFTTSDEKIALCHTAYQRDTFALGALTAARFLIKCAPGLYGMEDLLQTQLDLNQLNT